MFPGKNIDDKTMKRRDGAICIVLSFLILSCKPEAVTQDIDFEATPIQTVDSLDVTQSRNGGITMRMIAPTMERYQYEKDSLLQSYDVYPDSFFVFGYTMDGELETTVVARTAKHITTQDAEEWMVYGDVVITNYIQNQKLISDTIYWDQAEKKIFTDCYVRLENGQDVMQGYGMESDEMARNATILRPFDSYTVIQDSISRANAPYTSLDSVNLMGPFRKSM